MTSFVIFQHEYYRTQSCSFSKSKIMQLCKSLLINSVKIYLYKGHVVLKYTLQYCDEYFIIFN